MKKKLLFLIIVFGSIVVFGNRVYSKSDQLSTTEKVSDFKYMYNTIEEGYPYLDVNTRRTGKDWLSNKYTYINRIKDTKNDDEFVDEMSDILSELGNKHTEVINNKKDMNV
ncbi:hypothetical protein [Paraclostridium sp. AKS73]|uniref:hypothetical protein n=1 Tax=Paraclostridium sp. AKS73 TaxID=2876116 RepID=UPI0021DFDEDC|nr:hypothetical protein [Paraclostridium sp. AKS73]MCU9816288.1 hypothetical protein [Paraclostridium sp. AKS73]